MEFLNLDYLFIVLYFVLVFIVAYIKTRKSTDEDFLIAGRKLGVISTLSSINATKTGSIILIFTALLYAYGFSAMWYFLGVATGYLIFIPFAIRLHHAHGKTHYTLADYYFEKFGVFSGRCASLLNIFIMLAWLLLNLIASSKVLSFFTGLSFEISTIIVSVFVLVYLLIGGFKAVVTTDVLQYGAIIIIFLIFTFVLLKGVTISSAEWNMASAGIINILGFFLIGILLPFSAPDLWQRVYASRNLRVLKKGIIWSVVVYIVVAFLLALVGLAIKTQFPFIDGDIALIHGFATLLPSGLAGLAVVIFFAAFMSSIDTYAYTAASSFVHDFFRGISKKAEVRKIKYSVAGMIVFASLGAVLIQDLLLAGYMFAGYAIILAIPTIASWIKPNISGATINVSIITGFIVLTSWLIKTIITSSLDPSIVLVGIGSSLVGLVIGGIITYTNKSPTP